MVFENESSCVLLWSLLLRISSALFKVKNCFLVFLRSEIETSVLVFHANEKNCWAVVLNLKLFSEMALRFVK